MSQYYLDSAGDAATAGVFLLAAEALALKASPTLAFSSSVLYRGALVGLPLIATLRMVFRAKPDPNAPFQGSSMSAEDIYKRTWRLNILWMGAFYGGILQSVRDVPGSIADFLRGCLPIMTLLIWILLQRDALARRDEIETVSTDWKKKIKIRKKETLPQGLHKRDPLYKWYVRLEVLIFFELTVFSAAGLWPWLSGGVPDANFLGPVGTMAGFAASVLSWKYVKNSNRAAAHALQEEIDAPESGKLK